MSIELAQHSNLKELVAAHNKRTMRLAQDAKRIRPDVTSGHELELKQIGEKTIVRFLAEDQ